MSPQRSVHNFGIQRWVFFVRKYYCITAHCALCEGLDLDWFLMVLEFTDYWHMFHDDLLQNAWLRCYSFISHVHIGKKPYEPMPPDQRMSVCPLEFIWMKLKKKMCDIAKHLFGFFHNSNFCQEMFMMIIRARLFLCLRMRDLLELSTACYQTIYWKRTGKVVYTTVTKLSYYL